jgi:outer membrane immunogenic protein
VGIMNKVSLMGGALLGLWSGVACAADLPAYKARPAAPAPVWSWTGFYGGANVGYGWDRKDVPLAVGTTDPALEAFLNDFRQAGGFPASLSPSADGVIGGVQIGYNWQPAANWLFGLETDFQGSGIKGSQARTVPVPLFDTSRYSAEKKLDWFGTVRARLGVLATPSFLLYATGGLAYGKTKISFNVVNIDSGCIPDATLCANGSSSGVKAGWTAGAGIEAMLASNWSFKAEYLYVDLGSRSADIPASTVPAIIYTPSTKFQQHIARVGVNYHFNAGPVVARY